MNKRAFFLAECLEGRSVKRSPFLYAGMKEKVVKDAHLHKMSVRKYAYSKKMLVEKDAYLMADVVEKDA